MGRENPLEKIYDPKRVTLSTDSLKEFAKENADVAVQYVKDYLAPDRIDEQDIPAGEGRVVRHGMHKDRGLQGRERHAPPLLRRLHPPQVHRRVELGREELRLPLPRLALPPYGKVLNGPAIEALAPVDGPRARPGGTDRDSSA